MILNFQESKLIASCGWVEKSSLLILNPQTRREERVQISDAAYIVLKKALNNHFVCVHYFNGEFVMLSIHSWNDPATKLSEIQISSKGFEFKGNAALWQFAQPYYVAYLNDDLQTSDYRLITIDAKAKRIAVSRLEWYDDNYDKGYQAVLDVLAIPKTDFLLYSLQRSSSPVLFDIVKKSVDRRLKLAGRSGNPVFSFRNAFKELWCVDYDTLLKIDATSFKVLGKNKLQGATFGMGMQFLGEFTFTPNERYCAVARPFSKDVVLIDPFKLKILSTIKSRFEPLSITVFSNLDFIARDWKTGELEYGKFKI